MTTLNRVRAILGFSLVKIATLLAGAKNIYVKMSADIVRFPSPIPTLVSLQTLILNVENSQPAVESRTKGAKAIRTGYVLQLVSALEQLLKYVQNLADSALPDQATAIIVAAGMQVAAVPSHIKAALTLVNVKPTGTVLAEAYRALLTQKSQRNVTFHWSYSLDGEKSWQSLVSTPTAKTTITGLVPLSTVAVRVAVTVGAHPMTDWSQPVSLLVQ